MLGVGLGEPPDRDFADLGEEADPRGHAAGTASCRSAAASTSHPRTWPTTSHSTTAGRAGWDVVVHPAPGIPMQEYAEVGATWLVRSVLPYGEDWEAKADVTLGESPGTGSA